MWLLCPHLPSNRTFYIDSVAGGGTVWKYDVFDVSENIAHFGMTPTPKNAIDINTAPP
jgi:hypothetical protein